MKTVMQGVREYAEYFDVELIQESNGRLAIRAENEGGYNGTSVDLLDLIAWLKANRPELLRDDDSPRGDLIPPTGVIEVQDMVALPPGTGDVYQPCRGVPESLRLYVDGVLVAMGMEAVVTYEKAHPEIIGRDSAMGAAH